MTVSLEKEIIRGVTEHNFDHLSGYDIAYKQSFGFFHDISNENWRIAQKVHARAFPNHFTTDLKRYSTGINDKFNLKNIAKSSFWNAENFQEEFHCGFAQRLPSNSGGDGPKWICDPHRLSHVKDCLVYSIGSNGKIEFEASVKESIGSHCDIHTFDMVTSNKRNGDFASKLKPYATFHPWGMGTEEQAKKSPKVFKTLQQTMKELGHENRTIHIFKIDCEWCEWNTYDQWVKEDLRQILVETHNAPMPNAKEFFHTLHDAGYVIFSKEANFQNGGGCVEFGFLKLLTDFFVNDTMYNKN